MFSLAIDESRIVRRVQELQKAKEAVQPYVGAAAMGCDSVEGVYITALKHLGHNTSGLAGEPEAARAMFGALKNYRPRRTLAQDAKVSAARAERFPNANRLRHG